MWIVGCHNSAPPLLRRTRQKQRTKYLWFLFWFLAAKRWGNPWVFMYTLCTLQSTRTLYSSYVCYLAPNTTLLDTECIYIDRKPRIRIRYGSWSLSSETLRFYKLPCFKEADLLKTTTTGHPGCCKTCCRKKEQSRIYLERSFFSTLQYIWLYYIIIISYFFKNFSNTTFAHFDSVLSWTVMNQTVWVHDTVVFTNNRSQAKVSTVYFFYW